MEAGNQANIVIQNTQNAYADELKQTIGSLDTTRQRTFSNIDTLVNQLSDTAHIDIDTIDESSQQIINSLPFRPHEPQLTSVMPRFVVPSTHPYTVNITFHGNFEYAAQPSYFPVLQFGNREFTPASNTTQILTFAVPLDAMSFNAPSTSYGTCEAVLLVPWQMSRLVLFHKRVTDQYHVTLGSLPSNVGKIELDYNTTVSVPQTQNYTSGEYSQSSANGKNDDHHPYVQTPDQGWHIVPGTSKFNIDRAINGNLASYGISSDTNDLVNYWVTITYIDFSPPLIGGAPISSAIWWKISFIEHETQDVVTPHNQQITLQWGDSVAFSTISPGWKVTFDAFDGSHQEFIGPDTSNPFLKLSTPNDGLVISTADPKTLDWP